VNPVGVLLGELGVGGEEPLVRDDEQIVVAERLDSDQIGIEGGLDLPRDEGLLAVLGGPIGAHEADLDRLLDEVVDEHLVEAQSDELVLVEREPELTLEQVVEHEDGGVLIPLQGVAPGAADLLVDKVAFDERHLGELGFELLALKELKPLISNLTGKIFHIDSFALRNEDMTCSLLRIELDRSCYA